MQRLGIGPISQTALALRGYNVTNLGRTAELRCVPAYRPILDRWLDELGRICADAIGRRVDLIANVESGLEAGLDRYAEAVALIAAVELAQLEILETQHKVAWRGAKLMMGYSLGELVAVAAAGLFPPEGVLKPPLAMATDCAALAEEVTMGVLFSREAVIEESVVVRLCDEVTAEGRGVIGISAVLSPNTYLVLGQGQTLASFTSRIKQALPRASVRRNDFSWPPLHTPIVRQKHVPDRASVMMQSIPPTSAKPSPPILSLVTGKMSYGDADDREVLRQWVDHPQRLWDAVCVVLSSGVRTVVHVGPEPNLVPATFSRLAENVRQQTRGASLGAMGMRAVQGLVERPWLASLLPGRAALLRAPSIEQIVLEDWLLENAPVG